MKKRLAFFLFLILFCGVSIGVVHAQKPANPQPPADGGELNQPPADGGPLINCQKPPCQQTSTPGSTASGFTLSVRLQNPLKVDNITDAIRLFMNILLKIALPLIVLFFIWAGLQYILALGNPTKIQAAHKMFKYTVIGTLLILGAWTITNAIIGTINTLTN